MTKVLHFNCFAANYGSILAYFGFFGQTIGEIDNTLVIFGQ